jgi:hypothetical protein
VTKPTEPRSVRVGRFLGFGRAYALELGHANIHSWRDRMRKLNGEFRRSCADEILRYMVEGLITMISASALVTSYRQYAHIASDIWLCLCGICFITVSLVCWAARKNGIWYQFQPGSLSAISASGKLLWREDLSGLKAVQCTRGRTTSSLALFWSDRTRSIELYASLEDALSDGHRDR